MCRDTVQSSALCDTLSHFSLSFFPPGQYLFLLQTTEAFFTIICEVPLLSCLRMWGKTTWQTMQKLPKSPPFHLICSTRMSLYTHTHTDRHIKSSSTSEILQKRKISASELCPSPPTNGFQAGLWIFLFKSCSLRRGGDGKGKGHWEKAEGRSC